MSIRDLSFKDREEVLERAFGKLCENDRIVVSRCADDIVSSIKAKHPNVQINKKAALEVLAAIGMLYSRLGIKKAREWNS